MPTGALDRVGAVILAAGESTRMGGVDKLFVPLWERPLLAWSLELFQRCAVVDSIVLVMSPSNIQRGRTLVEEMGWTKVSGVHLGGERRQDSVHEGLKHLKDCHWVIIHDGARPLAGEGLIMQGLAAARQTGAAVAALPIKDTIKRVDEEGRVSGTLSRDGLWAIQTPQTFRYDLIVEAHRQVKDDVTDDAALIERLGGEVAVYNGSPLNIKVTEPQDLDLAEAIIRSNASRYGV